MKQIPVIARIKAAILAALLLSCSSVMAAEQLQITHQGLRLNAFLEGSLSDSKSPLFVLLHGTLGHYRMEIMTALQTLLKESQIDSMAINLSYAEDDRSASFYSCTKVHRHRHEDAVSEIAAWLDWLRLKSTRPIILLGHSRGGNHVVLAMGRYAESKKLAAAVMLAPMTWNMQQQSKSFAEQGQNLSHILRQARQPSTNLLQDIPFLHCAKTTVKGSSFLSYYAHTISYHTPDLLPKISQPLLLFSASEDDVVSDLDRQIRPHIKQANLRYYSVEGADHFFRDLYLDEVMEEILAFLRRHQFSLRGL